MAVGARGRTAKSSNSIVKVKKNSTAPNKRHHFESFSQRVATLNIDPIRRTRRHDRDETDPATTNSYFKTSLEKWQDLNLSEIFTGFVRNVRPLCESLPQILHHQDRIVDLLVQNLEKKDALSLEPLLSLVAGLAYDLGTRFEIHFARVVAVVSQLASKHPSIEVIEWSFNCLAWLFKYLSKLLVPDLRPLFDLVAPLLGKERQKPFIARFAAEAMSFLVRKAGAIHERDQNPLDIVVSHALKDLIVSADHEDTTLYSQGLMTLFVEAVTGTQKGFHTCAAAVIRCLTQQTLCSSKADNELLHPPDEVLLGVLTAISHHVDSETFRSALKWVLESFSIHSQPTSSHANALLEVLFAVISARKRKGDLDWSPFIVVLSKLIKQFTHHDSCASSVRKNAIRVFAMVVAYAPLDTLIPHLGLLDNMVSVPWEGFFLPFCTYLAELDAGRFRNLLVPYFQKYGPKHHLHCL